MTALLERPNRGRPIYSLWSKTQGRWHHMDTSHSEAELRLKAESLRRIFVHNLFIIVSGTMMPKD